MKLGFANLKAGFLFLLFFIYSTFVFSQATSIYAFQEWAKDTGLTNHVYKARSVLSSGDDIFTVGGTVNANGDYDILVTAYDRHGTLLWTAQHDENGLNDYGAGIALDEGSGYLFVTGAVTVDTAQGLDVGLLVYDLSGNLQSSASFDNGQSYPFYNEGGVSVVADGSSYVYISGSSQNSSTLSDFITLQYDYSSNLQWTQFFDDNNLEDYAGQIFYDGGSGNVTVTGLRQKTPAYHAITALEYDPSGSLVGSNTSAPAVLDSIDEVHDVVITSNGNIYYTGFINHAIYGRDAKVIMMDANLIPVWEYTAIAGGPGEGNAIEVDETNGFVYIAGYLDNGTNAENYFVYQLDTVGSFNWYYYYDGEAHGNDRVESMILDLNLNPVVTGYSNISSWDNSDYYTTKLDQSGNVIWGVSYNGICNNDDRAWEISIDDQNNTYVIGQSEDTSDTNSTWVTVKYVEHELFNVPDSDTIPTSFDVIPNYGQLLNADTITYVNTPVKYYCPQPSIYLENTKLIHLFSRVDTSATTQDTLVRVDMIFTNDTTRRVYAQNEKSWYYNFYYPHTAPTKGLCHVPNYEKLVYPDLYREIDINILANVKGIKEQFIVKQGGDADDIMFVYSGADTVYVDNGDLVIETILETIRYERPNASQIDSSGGYVNIVWQPIFKVSNDTVTFDSIQSYNSNLALVIEMQQGTGILGRNIGNLDWSTFVGGDGDEAFYDSYISVSNSLVVTGYSGSTNFPTTPGTYQGANAGNIDAVAQKFNSNGGLLWSTYFGGSGYDYAKGITSDNVENITFVGYASSTDIIMTPLGGAYNDNSHNGGVNDGFVCKLSPSGTTMLWSTYYGGNGDDQFRRVETDLYENIFIVGKSLSSNFPGQASGGQYTQSYGTVGDGVILKFNNSGARQWATYYGGSASDEVTCVDSYEDDGSLFVAGTTWSSDLSTQDPGGGAYYDGSFNGGGDDIFIAGFNNNGDRIFSTYYGNSGCTGSEQASGIVIRHSDTPDFYVIGTTHSNDFLTQDFGGSAFYQGTLGNSGSGADAFILEFEAGPILQWATYFGGSSTDFGEDITLDADNNLYVTGYTASTNFPFQSPNPVNTYEQGSEGAEAFIASFDADFDDKWGTYFGGTDFEYGYSVSADNLNKLYLVGTTGTTETYPVPFPLDNGGGIPYFDGTFGGNAHDAYIARFNTVEILIGVEELQNLGLDLMIFPNPAYSELNLIVNSVNAQHATVTVFDITGKKLVSYPLSLLNGENKLKLDVSNYASGIYFIRIENGTFCNSTKFIKM